MVDSSLFLPIIGVVILVVVVVIVVLVKGKNNSPPSPPPNAKARLRKVSAGDCSYCENEKNVAECTEACIRRLDPPSPWSHH